ncbi:hypothetical protein Patl1_25995 [Pistacia atlantica]|uniref:Uncharacterized protein n=1 Tax=Pistacia atlantica TaxID=434234 RepID=A0ACC1B4Y8_9ROSI|nr:hypothetical protein Patl1_25995 [Pistacia atlantica]
MHRLVVKDHSNPKSVQGLAITGAPQLHTESHAYSSATSVAKSACVFLLALTEIKKNVLATTTGKLKKVDLSVHDLIQRERDRERAQARGGSKGKNKDDGLTPEQRRERDAKALQEKMAKKAAQAAGGDSAGGNSNNKK